MPWRASRSPASGCNLRWKLRSNRPDRLKQLSRKRRDRSSSTMSDVKHLHDVAVDRKQNAIHVRPAAIEKLTDFSR